MAHFRSTIQGHRGEASRLGTKASGMITTLNGWSNGLRATISYSDQYQADVIKLYATTGSSYGNDNFIMSYYRKPDGQLIILNSAYPELQL